jgi:adenylate kinase family enzyme
MKRIMVIGCCGAGKSTLATTLHQLLDLPLIHLDQHYWKADWVETEREEWEAKVMELASNDEWIIDGNYSGSMDIRLNRADTVIYLDYPAIKCLSRVLKRIRMYKGETRPDMPAGCNERYDLDFLHYVATFNIRKRRFLYNKLNAWKSANKQVVILKNDIEVEKYINKLKFT